jgi:hypothetical protein
VLPLLPLPTLAAACRACHVVVGTTGRILSLIQRGMLRTSAVRILVLDEADKLLGGAPARQAAPSPACPLPPACLPARLPACPLACLLLAAWC